MRRIQISFAKLIALIHYEAPRPEACNHGPGLATSTLAKDGADDR